MKSIESPDIESSSFSYANRFAGEVGDYFLKTQLDAVSGYAGLVENTTVLDVGGGHAQLTPYFVSEGADVTVLGSDEKGRIQLDSLLDSKSYRYVAGNLLNLPFEDNSFDTVIAIRLLPHLVNWQAFTHELCRVAKTSVIVDYPDKRSFNYFADYLFSAKKAIEKDTRTYQCFSAKQIESSFAEVGYISAGAFRQFALPMALHRAVGRRSFSIAAESFAQKTRLRQAFGSPVIQKFLVTS